MKEEATQISDEELLSDPVFQLNVLLWALQDLPSSNLIKPILRQAGYELRYIEHPLIIPNKIHVINALEKLTGSRDQSQCRPDLWLKHSEDKIDLIVELKSQGFSRDSSNVRQASKLMLATYDLSESLGITSPLHGHLLYATIQKDAEKLAKTLNELAEELTIENVKVSPTAVIGFSITANGDGVALSNSSQSSLPRPAAQALQSPALVLQRENGNDLLPLYLIPWLPGIKKDQNSKLHSYGLEELTRRVLVCILAEIGRAETPTDVVLKGDKIMNEATFGTSDLWRSEDRKKFGEQVVKIIERTLQRARSSESNIELNFNRVRQGQIEIALPDSATQKFVLKQIEQTEPTEPSTSLKEAIDEQNKLLTLF